MKNMNLIYAPFTLEQIDALNQYQIGASFLLIGHAFTCLNRSDGNHGSEGGDTGLLIAIESGWVCPHCEYTQNSAWDFMVKSSSDPQIKKSTSDFMSRAMAVGHDISQFELDRVEQAIEDYQALGKARMVSVCQTNEENEKTERIEKYKPFMLASLRRRRMQHFGVLIDPKDVHSSFHPNVIRPHSAVVDATWTACKVANPPNEMRVQLLFQDEVLNPAHDGYGCNAWIGEGAFENDIFLSTGGYVTHWREIPQPHTDRKVRKLEANL